MFRGLVQATGFVLWFWAGAVAMADHIRVTSGSSGPACEDDLQKCLTRKTACISGRCRCAEGTTGRGDFACNPPESVHAEVLNDPNIRTFARDRVPLPVACRYLFTHFRTRFTGWNSSTCEVVVHAFNSKHAGKVFVHGLDLAVRVATFFPDDSMSAEPSFRVHGTADRGIYTFQESGSLQFRPDGPWEVSELPVVAHLPETVVRTRYDPYNNFAVIEVKTCGFVVKLRPYDTAYGKNQVLVPGLSVSVDPAYEPEWLSLDRVTALVPEGEPSLAGISLESGLEPKHAILLRLAHSGAIQNQPDAAPECTRWPEAARLCPDVQRRRLSFQTCTVILQTSRLVRCLDASSNGNVVLALFIRCFSSVCSADTSTCRQVQEKVATCSKILHLPPVQAFLRPDTCNNIVI